MEKYASSASVDLNEIKFYVQWEEKIHFRECKAPGNIREMFSALSLMIEWKKVH